MHRGRLMHRSIFCAELKAPNQSQGKRFVSFLALLRNYIEIRAFDMVPPDLQYALVTLVHALFYDVRGLKAAEDIVGGFDAHTIELLIQEAIRTTGNPSSDTTTTSYSSMLSSICRAILTIATENTPHERRTLLAPLKERLPELWSPPESLEEWVRGNLL
jgi:hypothetical protein